MKEKRTATCRVMLQVLDKRGLQFLMAHEEIRKTAFLSSLPHKRSSTARQPCQSARCKSSRCNNSSLAMGAIHGYWELIELHSHQNLSRRLLIHNCCSCSCSTRLYGIAWLLWICSPGLFSLIFLRSRVWRRRLSGMWMLSWIHHQRLCDKFHSNYNTCTFDLSSSSPTIPRLQA